jgi:hypothetical protein
MQGKIQVFAITSAIAFVAASLLSLAPASTAFAQSSGPQFLITWQASNSYAPPGYTGKILPNSESRITASVEILSNGKLVNISGQTVYWYLDDNFLGGGIGAQRVTFRPYGTAPTTMTLKVELPDYPGQTMIHEINIPLAAPQAIIDAAYPAGQFATSPVNAQALPFFFNVTSSNELSFAWTVNGQTVTSAENPQTLQISLPQSTPAGFAVGINLGVTNPSDSSQATASTNLTYQKQL